MQFFKEIGTYDVSPNELALDRNFLLMQNEVESVFGDSDQPEIGFDRILGGLESPLS